LVFWPLSGALIYLLIGTIWSVYRWFRHVNTEVERFNDGEIPEYRLTQETEVKQNKALITSWIAYWPWNAFWNIFGDIFSGIFNAIKNVYQTITDKALAKKKRK
jgi:hypothetical protein